MDPITLSAAALAVMIPLAKGVTEKLAEDVGRLSVQKAEQFFVWLKGELSSDPSDTRDFGRFVADPDRFGSALELSVREKIEREPEFGVALTEKLEQVGPTLAIFQKIADTKRAVGLDADEIKSGSFSVVQDASKVDELTGIRVKTIG